MFKVIKYFKYNYLLFINNDIVLIKFDYLVLLNSYVNIICFFKREVVVFLNSMCYIIGNYLLCFVSYSNVYK